MSPCCHCGGDVEAGWQFDDLAQMVADNAYPPSACGWCWYRVAASDLSAPCSTPTACPHVVREP